MEFEETLSVNVFRFNNWHILAKSLNDRNLVKMTFIIGIFLQVIIRHLVFKV